MSHAIMFYQATTAGNNENVTVKLNFALSKVLCDFSMLITLFKIGGVHFRLLGTNVFLCKGKE